ncbi:S9 family peptidase [Shewanella baltica]|uniref:alpha/beta hydrolase family protein n=1 Tax=Shewanella baltica TaxID=62322 RepID=UPI00217F1AA9|nr:prolyl oligopeptidase family serine peptidase [Shewanella baltica]MCS6261417.1 S9 family peptidase [Shewanella baltica]
MNKQSFLRFVIGCFATLLSSLVTANSLATGNDIWSELLDQSSATQLYAAPNSEFIAILHQVSYPSLATIAEPSQSLAGEIFNTSIASRPNQQGYSHISLITAKDKSLVAIKPERGVIIDYSWAPDSSSLALLIQDSSGIRLWDYDVAQQRLAVISKLNISASIGDRHLRWLPDSSAILVKAIVKTNSVSTINLSQLRISSTDEKVSEGRTYQYLLNTPNKRQDFTSIAQSQLIKIDLQGNSQAIGHIGFIYHFTISPDGSYILLENLPSIPSSSLPLKKWGREYSVVNLLSRKHIYQLPRLADNPSVADEKDRVPEGARSVQWLPFELSTISWVEAMDHGDMAKEQTIHDMVYSIPSPFIGDKIEVLPVAWRYHDLIWSPSGIGLLQEWHYQNKLSRTQLLKYRQPRLTKILSQVDYRDKYTDIGDPMTLRTPEGNRVLLEGKDHQVYMKAMGFTKSGTSPFVDTYTLYHDSKERIFISKESKLEVPLTMVGSSLIISSETSSESPKYLMLSGDAFKQESVLYNSKIQYPLTYEPQIINYLRKDGLQLQGILHLPNSATKKYLENKKIPAVLWVYPQSFKSKMLSQQRSVIPNQFRQFDPLGPLPFLHDNIAVFESTSMPILANGDGEPNDQFIEQLIMNAEAAVKALDETGIVDIKRIAVVGHSYGAFAVANLLAHTNLFSTGIARSGAYNRTLTPFGFQGEQRTLWQAQQSYLTMSPFLYVDRINEPLLLVHGEKDLNSGTFPEQSTRMYHALSANQKIAKLIILPYEGHQYLAKENLHQLLIQQSDWLDRWLKLTNEL